MSEKNINWWKVALIALVAFGLLAGGFILGRRTIDPPTPPGPIYVPGDTVYVDKPYPEPVYVNKPTDTANVILACIKSGRYYELFPEKVRDSLIFVTPEDSSLVIRDWATERFYVEKLFDCDTVGTLTVKAKTQYNRLEWLNTTFVPVTKVIAKPTPVKKYAPFAGGGITTSPSVLGQAGVFFDDKYGFSGVYQYDWDRKKHVVGTAFLLKF
jgi:hypothetical protein